MLTSSPAVRLMLFARSLEGTEFVKRGGKLVKISRGAKGQFGDMIDGPELDAIIANPVPADRDRLRAHFGGMTLPQLRAEAKARGAYLGTSGGKEMMVGRLADHLVGHKLDAVAIRHGILGDESLPSTPEPKARPGSVAKALLSGDPSALDGFNREQLRREAGKRGIALKRGASADAIKDALWDQERSGVDDEAELPDGDKLRLELSRMTLPQLKERAKTEGLKGYSKLRKAELVDRMTGDRIDGAFGPSVTKSLFGEGGASMLAKRQEPLRDFTDEELGLEPKQVNPFRRDKGRIDAAFKTQANLFKDDWNKSMVPERPKAELARPTASPAARRHTRDMPDGLVHDIERDVRAAHLAAVSQPGRNEYSFFSEWRAPLDAKYGRANVDAVIVDLGSGGSPDSGFYILGETNQKTLTPERRAGAVRMGGQDNHLLSLRTSVDPATPKLVPARPMRTALVASPTQAPSPAAQQWSEVLRQLRTATADDEQKVRGLLGTLSKDDLNDIAGELETATRPKKSASKAAHIDALVFGSAGFRARALALGGFQWQPRQSDRSPASPVPTPAAPSTPAKRARQLLAARPAAARNEWTALPVAELTSKLSNVTADDEAKVRGALEGRSKTELTAIARQIDTVGSAGSPSTSQLIEAIVEGTVGFRARARAMGRSSFTASSVAAPTERLAPESPATPNLARGMTPKMGSVLQQIDDEGGLEMKKADFQIEYDLTDREMRRLLDEGLIDIDDKAGPGYIGLTDAGHAAIRKMSI